MDFKKAMDTIVEEVRRLVSELLSNAPYDRCYTGVVLSRETTKVVNKYRYKIKISGSTKNICAYCLYEVGDYVKVLVPENSWDKAFFISEAVSSGFITIATNAMTNANYIPKKGEMVLFYSGNTTRMKIGDGVTAVNSLQYSI